ncbi:Glycogen [starch] synthase [Smittium mucronatum]|uniref:Glycogen [starch] synthase n=1 Tax=Smittium mucronatum TaxID=133383 RepID=A0A1R0GYD4_9FUNG|nr:Glycogen [starch] synthase [Smittium mucronatum]
MRDIRNSLLFECSWEVANKVGGIYTVIKTKAPITSQEYGNRFYMIGPYNPKQANVEVEQSDLVDVHSNDAVKQMRDEGFNIITGRWLIEGAPQVILLDIHNHTANAALNSWKAQLWEKTKIPSPEGDSEMDDAIKFGFMAYRFFTLIGDKNLAAIGHFHEWQTGISPVLIKTDLLPIATVFPPHATLLGRYLCAGDTDFYNNIRHFDVDAEAGKRGIYNRYCVERAAAHSADVFTTVSNITAYEAEHLLKRKPDGVLPNGLNVVKFSATHEFQNLHQKSKLKINEFVRGHFYGHFDKHFDLENNTLYFFTAGRYEYRNKGLDLFIESLSRLNERLKSCNSPITVVAFIIAPASVNNFSVEALKGQAIIKQLRESVGEITDKISSKIFNNALREEPIDLASLLDEKDKILLKRRALSLKRANYPPIVTHNMNDDANDPVLNQLRRLHMFNANSDRVKVVFYPEFLNSNNPVLGMDYEDFVRGTHMGVFPSYYEPWGYTPSECTVLGVPSITTNLSGFGCFMEDTIICPEDYGIYIVDRRLKSVDESVNQLADIMFSYCKKTRRQRINQRNRTERLGDILDWKRLGIEYVKARHFALRRRYPEDMQTYESNLDLDHSSGKLSRPLSIPGTPPGADELSGPNNDTFYSNLLAGLTVSSELPGVRLQDDDDDDLRPPINLKMKTPVLTPSGYSSSGE